MKGNLVILSNGESERVNVGFVSSGIMQKERLHRKGTAYPFPDVFLKKLKRFLLEIVFRRSIENPVRLQSSLTGFVL